MTRRESCLLQAGFCWAIAVLIFGSVILAELHGVILPDRIYGIAMLLIFFGPIFGNAAALAASGNNRYL